MKSFIILFTLTFALPAFANKNTLTLDQKAINTGWATLPSGTDSDCEGRVRFFTDNQSHRYLEIQGSACHELTISKDNVKTNFPLNYQSAVLDFDVQDGYGAVIQIDGDMNSWQLLNAELSTENAS